MQGTVGKDLRWRYGLGHNLMPANIQHHHLNVRCKLGPFPQRGMTTRIYTCERLNRARPICTILRAYSCNRRKLSYNENIFTALIW